MRQHVSGQRPNHQYRCGVVANGFIGIGYIGRCPTLGDGSPFGALNLVVTEQGKLEKRSIHSILVFGFRFSFLPFRFGSFN
ncbi:MAG: hypothetical protein LBQ50_13630 [Planctomycetaceae bacterium]|jgi:hypothetical protein|nr:hypothetical protein [Planctomycetaceae bacterium]